MLWVQDYSNHGQSWGVMMLKEVNNSHVMFAVDPRGFGWQEGTSASVG